MVLKKISTKPLTDLTALTTKVKVETKRVFKHGGRIALKLHMGERGGLYYLNPKIAAALVKVLQQNGYQPFLFDSPVVYPGGRMTNSAYLRTAARHGYTEKNIGCPIVISNRAVPVRVAGFTYGVCRDLVEADGLLVLTHVKGHECTGMGGAIKNLGMGGVDKKTKRAMHNLARPVQRDVCRDCGVCAGNCPGKAITVFGKKIKLKLACYGCGICIVNCPYQVLAPKDRLIDDFIGQAAAAVVRSVPAVYGVNVLKNIVAQCDCYTGRLRRLAPDLGYVAGPDIAQIDEASIQVIKQKLGQEIFEKTWKKSPFRQIKAFAKALK
jgi:uncharacterized protein